MSLTLLRILSAAAVAVICFGMLAGAVWTTTRNLRETVQMVGLVVGIMLGIAAFTLVMTFLIGFSVTGTVPWK